VVTKKGKGYPPAESDPVKFHGAGSFEISTGKSLSKPATGTKSYTEVFSEKLVELASSDKRIIAVTAAMAEGTGLDKFRDAYPERFFDVGIAEEHAVCFAAGLAACGLKPVVAIYSTFLQRAYDQIIEDVALQGLPVVFAVDRAGIVGEDGKTHQGIFDIVYLRSIPNMVIMSPKDDQEFEQMLAFAFTLERPAVIRYPRAICALRPHATLKTLSLGEPELLKSGPDFAVIALGSMVANAFQAVESLEKEGYSGSLLSARFAKPIDADAIQKVTRNIRHVFTVEEGIIDGGFGSAVSECLNRQVIKIGLPCEFIAHGKRDILLEQFGLSAQAIHRFIKMSITEHGKNKH
jgi:1-deoxy-D-xylulose-5-phosphate synthase